MSLLDQLKDFADASESIRADVTNEELAQLTKDISTHIDEILEYIDIVERDAEVLRDAARKYGDAAKQQENKAARIKDYVKFALKSQGFTRFSTGKNRITLSTTNKIIPKRPATTQDYLNTPELLDLELAWNRSPTIEEWINTPENIAVQYVWKMDAVESAGRDDLIDYKPSDRLIVKVLKK